MKNKAARVVVFGSVGINRGDDLMNRVIINYVKKSGADVASASIVPSESTKNFSSYYFNSRFSNITEWIKKIYWSNVVIIGGGTIVQDDFNKKFGGILAYAVAVTLVAVLLKKPVVAVGIGLNPLRTKKSKLLVSAINFWGEIYVRDQWSLDVNKKEKYYKKNIKIMPDLAFCSDFFDCEDEEKFLPQQKNYIVLSLAKENVGDVAQKILSEAIEYCDAFGLSLHCLAMDQRNEEEISLYQSISSKKNIKIIVPKTPNEAFRIIENSVQVVSMRLHSSIISLLAKKVPIVISREGKTLWLKDWIPEHNFINAKGYESGALYKALSQGVQGDEISQARLKEMNDQVRIVLDGIRQKYWD